MGLEPVPLQLEHVDTDRNRNQYSNNLGQNSVAGRQARFFVDPQRSLCFAFFFAQQQGLSANAN